VIEEDVAVMTEEKSSTPAQRILERAIEVINDAGEAAIRTNPIAAECGVTPPILYRAFGSREGLVIAAQAERYKRSTEVAASLLIELVASATSRADLVDKVSRALDYIYSDSRRGAREIRASVIGSAISRPQLKAEIVKVDARYMEQITNSYAAASRNGWVKADVNLPAIAIWAQGLTNSRLMVEFSHDEALGAQWNELAKSAILRAIFGEL